MVARLRVILALYLALLLCLGGCTERRRGRSITMMLESQALGPGDKSSRLLILWERPTPHYLYEDFDAPESMQSEMPFRKDSGQLSADAFEGIWNLLISARVAMPGELDIRHGEAVYDSLLVMRDGGKTSVVTVGRMSLYWWRGAKASPRSEDILRAWKKAYTSVDTHPQPMTRPELSSFLDHCGEPWPDKSVRLALWYNAGRMLGRYPANCLSVR